MAKKSGNTKISGRRTSEFLMAKGPRQLERFRARHPSGDVKKHDYKKGGAHSREQEIAIILALKEGRVAEQKKFGKQMEKHLKSIYKKRAASYKARGKRIPKAKERRGLAGTKVGK